MCIDRWETTLQRAGHPQTSPPAMKDIELGKTFAAPDTRSRALAQKLRRAGVPGGADGRICFVRPRRRLRAICWPARSCPASCRRGSSGRRSSWRPRRVPCLRGRRPRIGWPRPWMMVSNGARRLSVGSAMAVASFAIGPHIPADWDCVQVDSGVGRR